MRHLWAAVLDWQVWLHILIYMSIIAPCKSPFKPASLRLALSLVSQYMESRCSFRKFVEFLHFGTYNTPS